MVSFIPELVAARERHNHLHLSVNVREKLLIVSRSTVDRIFSLEKESAGRSINTIKPDKLIKHQIQVRIFADWDDARCGGKTNGAFVKYFDTNRDNHQVN